uniref:Uncharacterized protein n=1 Tax=Triticum urartu TaxID=4572 RepID=A0A8R7Q2Q1_TRIUA
MFWHKEPDIKYYVCTINRTFAKPGQRMVTSRTRSYLPYHTTISVHVNHLLSCTSIFRYTILKRTCWTALIQIMIHSWSDLQMSSTCPMSHHARN